MDEQKFTEAQEPECEKDSQVADGAEKSEKCAKEKKCGKKDAEKDKRIGELEALANDYKDKWMRNVAEFDNYKKRNAKIWQEAFNEGASSIIKKILPIGDNLDWAMTLGLDEKTLEGISSIKRKFNETLKSMDIEEINPVGEPFDPNVAEAVMQVEGGEGEESDTVKQVFEKGYRIKERIIRYAKVSVIK